MVILRDKDADTGTGSLSDHPAAAAATATPPAAPSPKPSTAPASPAKSKPRGVVKDARTIEIEIAEAEDKLRTLRQLHQSTKQPKQEAQSSGWRPLID